MLCSYIDCPEILGIVDKTVQKKICLLYLKVDIYDSDGTFS